MAHFNAAIIHAQTLDKVTYKSLHDDIQIGITGALYSLKAFAPAMLARHSGAFLPTGGMLANDPLPQYLALGVAKAGIKNITHALFNNFREKKVHIATVTVSAAVAPASDEATGVAECFWGLYNQPEKEWSCETEYRSRR